MDLLDRKNLSKTLVAGYLGLEELGHPPEALYIQNEYMCPMGGATVNHRRSGTYMVHSQAFGLL
ncbi:MAG: hypothetical protein RI601_00350 [Desulfurivibrionaceae bacterium]|nr:hypothetical protein [Desulfurivibrionaceae bacterium]